MAIFATFQEDATPWPLQNSQGGVALGLFKPGVDVQVIVKIDLDICLEFLGDLIAGIDDFLVKGGFDPIIDAHFQTHPLSS